MRAIFATALPAALAAALALAQPAAGQMEDESNESMGDSAGELTAEAVDKLLRALDLFIGSIPQYDAPYVNENGDIIIRRRHSEPDGDLPTPEQKPAPPDVIDTTTT